RRSPLFMRRALISRKPISMAAPSRLAIRLARPARGSPARSRACCSAKARRSALQRSASAAGRGSPRFWRPAEMTIERVAVIGAGVMGAAIAAHVANAGVPVVLLDIVPKDAKNRNALAEGAIAAMLKTNPAPFMHKKNARLITPGNLEDNLELLADCDWICEAVVENLAIKQDLYKRLDGVRKAGSIVTSNTSTIPLKSLMAGMPESLQKDFAITHFFNPPRYMRLFELVGGEKTRKDALEALRRFADIKLGKE